GIYRSLTIHPEIIEGGATMRSTGRGDELVYPCPPGTVVELERSGARLALRIDEVGRLEESARTRLIDLLRIEGELRAWIGGFEVSLIDGHLDALRAEARARVREEEEARRRAAQPTPRSNGEVEVAPPPPPPSRIRIEVDGCINP